jgi:hypothetical protein
MGEYTPKFVGMRREQIQGFGHHLPAFSVGPNNPGQHCLKGHPFEQVCTCFEMGNNYHQEYNVENRLAGRQEAFGNAVGSLSFC